MAWLLVVAALIIVASIILKRRPSGNDAAPSYRSDRREVQYDNETHRFYPMAVVGESHQNSDGTTRQSIIANCRSGDSVRLVPEPTNRHDPNAIKVVHSAGQIGYIPAEAAARIRDDIETGRFVSATILGISGPPGYLGASLQIKALRGRIKKKPKGAA